MEEEIQSLIEILMDEDLPPCKRIESAASLGEIRSERSIDPLIGVLGLTPDEWSFDVKTSLNEDYDPDLIKLSFFAAEALGFADIRALEPLVKLDMIRPNLFYEHSVFAINNILLKNVPLLFSSGTEWAAGSGFLHRSYYSSPHFVYPNIGSPLGSREHDWFQLVCSLNDLREWDRITMFLDSESPMERLSATWLAGYSCNVSGMLDAIRIEDPHPAVRWCALRSVGKLLNNLTFDLFIDGSIEAYATEWYDGDRMVSVEELRDTDVESKGYRKLRRKPRAESEGAREFRRYVDYGRWKSTHANSFSSQEELWGIFERLVDSLVRAVDDSTLVRVELIYLLCKIDVLFFLRKGDEEDRIFRKILSLCRDEVPLVRRTALKALSGFCHYAQAFEELRRALSDSGFKVAATAIDVLEGLKHEGEAFGASSRSRTYETADDVLNEAIENGLVTLEFFDITSRDGTLINRNFTHISKFDK